MTTREIHEKYLEEFNKINDLFIVHELSLDKESMDNPESVFNPGVYVFLKGNDVIKVGRSFSNSRKRALEHIRDNTQIAEFQMIDLPTYPDAKLLLYNLKEKEKYHWAAALEVYFEDKLEPKIKSKRRG